MKNILWVLLLAAGVFGADTTLTWISTVSTDMNLITNYASDPAGAIAVNGPNKLLRFIDTTGTEAIPTASANISVKSFVIETGFPVTATAGTKNIEAINRYMVDAAGGFTAGRNLTLSGDGQIHIAPTGTLLAAPCTVFVSGTTDTLDNDKANAIYNNIRVAASCTFLSTGGGAVIFRSSNLVSAALIVGDNATVTFNGSSNTTFQPSTVSDTVFRIGGGVAFNGTAPILIGTNTAAMNVIIPAVTYTGTGIWSIITTTGIHGDSFTVVGNINVGSNTLNILNASVTSAGVVFINSASTITAGKTALGTVNASASNKYVMTGSTINADTVSITSTGIDSVYMPSVWYVAGSWLDAAPGAGDLRSIGTSHVIFTNTKKALLQTKNHSLHWYDVTFRATATDSLDDSLTGHTVAIDSTPFFKFGSKNMNLTGDFLCRGRAGDSVVARTTSNVLTFQNAATFQVLTQQTAVESLTVNPMLPLYFNIDKGVKIRRVAPTDGKKITISAGKTLTLAKNVVRDFTGTTAAPDSVVSSSAGNKTRIAFTIQPEDTALYLKDVAAQGFIWYDTIGGINGGGDSNVVFKDAAGAKYLTPSYPTITTLTPDTGTDAGGSTITIAGTELFAPCSISLDTTRSWNKVTLTDSTSGTFVTPAKGTGGLIRRVDLKNADFNVVTKLAAFTYNASTPPTPSVTPRRRGMGIGLGLSYLDGAFMQRAYR